MKRGMVFLAFLLVLGIAGSAWAAPANLGEILGDSALTGYTDTGAEAVSLTHTGLANPDATAFLLFHSGSYIDGTSFGIFDLTSGNMLEVFANSDSPVTSATLAFDLKANTVTNQSSHVSASIGTTFGFYLVSPDGTFYSQTSRNVDGFDHAMLFNTTDNTYGQLLGADVVVAFEDLWAGGDQNFRDMVVGVSDVTAVPVPAAIWLLGSGLLGLFGVRRKNSQAI